MPPCLFDLRGDGTVTLRVVRLSEFDDTGLEAFATFMDAQSRGDNAAARETAALLRGQKLHWPYVVLPGIEPGHPRVFRSEFYPTRRIHGPLALAPDEPPGVAFPPDAAAIFAAALSQLP